MAGDSSRPRERDTRSSDRRYGGLGVLVGVVSRIRSRSLARGGRGRKVGHAVHAPAREALHKGSWIAGYMAAFAEPHPWTYGQKRSIAEREWERLYER